MLLTPPSRNPFLLLLFVYPRFCSCLCLWYYTSTSKIVDSMSQDISSLSCRDHLRILIKGEDQKKAWYLKLHCFFLKDSNEQQGRAKKKRNPVREEQTRFVLYLETFTALAFSCFFFVLPQPTLSASSLDPHIPSTFLKLLFLFLSLWTCELSAERRTMSLLGSKIMNWKRLLVATNGNGHRSHRPLTAPDILWWLKHLKTTSSS